MKLASLWRLSFLALTLGALTVLTPVSARVAPGSITTGTDAAACSRCTTCTTCGAASHGGNSCDFKGPPACPCRELGGNCNPSLSLNVLPEDRRIVETAEGEMQLVRLDDSVFGTWACETGQLRLAYRESGDVRLIPLDNAELARYRDEVSPGEYVRVLSSVISQ